METKNHQVTNSCSGDENITTPGDGNINSSDDENITQKRKNKRNNKINTEVQKKEIRNKYGQYENVLLSDTDIGKLKKEFPTDWEQRIEELSGGVAAKGYKYNDFLAAIRIWAKNDKNKQLGQQPRSNFEIIQ